MDIIVGRVYRHFKGNYYLVLDFAFHSETKEEFVVYKALYGDCKVYIRPKNMFLEKIDKARNDNVTNQSYRFELVK